MLPYIEQQALYSAANFSWGIDPFGDPCYYVNSTVANTVINGFLCPSDPNSDKPNINSYYACVGTTTNFMTVNCWGGINPACAPTGSTGMFTYWQAYGLRDCTDGASNTIAYAESLTGKPNVGNQYRGNSTQGVTDPGAQLYDANSNPAVIIQGYRPALWRSRAARASSRTTASFGPSVRAYSLFQTIQTPNDSQYQFGSCTFGCAGCGLDQSWTVDASSSHAGGVNILMSDGGVRFVKNSINRNAWWALGTKDNGEVLSADSY